MSHTIQAYRCGPDIVKIIARSSHNYIAALPDNLNEREKENKRTSLSRSRRTVADILHCNYFRFFLTVTIKNNENGSSPTRDDVVQICKNGCALSSVIMAGLSAISSYRSYLMKMK